MLTDVRGTTASVKRAENIDRNRTKNVGGGASRRSELRIDPAYVASALN